MEIINLASHAKEMRDLQKAYFASRKENRYGDKKILAASKAKELEFDQLVDTALENEQVANPFWQESQLMESCRITRLTWLVALDDAANGHLYDLWNNLTSDQWQNIFGFEKHNEFLTEDSEPNLVDLYEHFMEGMCHGLIADFEIRVVKHRTPDHPISTWYSGFTVYANSLTELAEKMRAVVEQYCKNDEADERR